MKENRKWLSVDRKHRTYWVSEEEDRFIREYLERNRETQEKKRQETAENE